MADLETRVRRLEEIQAIERLKNEYGRLIDAGLAGSAPFPQPEFMDQFTDDAVWEANYHGRFEGKEAIREFFAGVADAVSFSLHYMVAPAIDVASPWTAATANWYTFETLTVNGRVVWLAAHYDDVYTKRQGRWQFQHVTATIHYMTPYETGWVREPFIS